MNQPYQNRQNRPHHQGGGRPQQNEDAQKLLNGFDPMWISSGLSRQAIDFTEQMGKYLAGKRMTTSQIRNVFGEVKRIQSGGFTKEDRTSFLLLRPKLAYAAQRASGRDTEQAMRDFRAVMDKAHEAVDLENPAVNQQFQNFCDFFEAVLAYHKAYGGKE